MNTISCKMMGQSLILKGYEQGLVWSSKSFFNRQSAKLMKRCGTNENRQKRLFLMNAIVAYVRCWG